ncbi:MAG: DUF3540 domain-containing protein [Pseudomonadota bacterium]
MTHARLASRAQHHRRQPRETLAPSAATPGGGIRTARVIACTDATWVVQCGSLRLQARRAASCLLLPELGDSVACLTGEDVDQDNEINDDTSGCWLLAVLERAADGTAQAGTARPAARLRVDGDLRLEVRGDWQVEAARVSVKSTVAELHTRDARIGFDTLKSIGRVLQVTVQQTRWVGQELVAVVDRWMQHAKTTHRHTEGMEQASAGHMELAARGVLHVKAPHVLTEGSDLVKTRGSQIHFG